jgi:RsiW-degrading membrane proteinase PrsW (M82 family)
VFGGLIGAGFAFSEQIMYFGQIVMRYLTRDPSDGVALFMLAASFILRGVMVPLMHPFLVAMAGLGVAAASTTQNRLLRYFLAAIGFLAAIALHGIWDWAGLASDDRYLIYKIYAGVMFPLFLAIVTFAIRLRNRRAREFYPVTSGRRMPA